MIDALTATTGSMINDMARLNAIDRGNITEKGNRGIHGEHTVEGEQTGSKRANKKGRPSLPFYLAAKLLITWKRQQELQPKQMLSLLSWLFLLF